VKTDFIFGNREGGRVKNETVGNLLHLRAETTRQRFLA